MRALLRTESEKTGAAQQNARYAIENYHLYFATRRRDDTVFTNWLALSSVWRVHLVSGT
ncbi:hypothetical protein WH47_01780 [Habropoda laboriosa]|uniref:Uncharacterized protein n=1 Tax=Habropoda laboriosa TaxID=597456 RepID=A0A0L7RJK1_9HYME|nr:hypothetical protein WH47_01780 [Habropoda laboriosa]